MLDVLRTVMQTAVAAGAPVHEYLVSVLRTDPDTRLERKSELLSKSGQHFRQANSRNGQARPDLVAPFTSIRDPERRKECSAELPAVLTVSEAAAFLRLDKRTVRDLFHRGELAGNRAGKAIRISGQSALSWLRGKAPVSGSRRTRWR